MFERAGLGANTAASKKGPPQGQPSGGEAAVTDSGASACSAAAVPHRFLTHLFVYSDKNEMTHSFHVAIFGNGFFGAPASEAPKAEAEAAAEEGRETAEGRSSAVFTLVRISKTNTGNTFLV